MTLVMGIYSNYKTIRTCWDRYIIPLTPDGRSSNLLPGLWIVRVIYVIRAMVMAGKSSGNEIVHSIDKG